MSKYLLGPSIPTPGAAGLIRCAIYARYSSDNQRASSIDDQIRNCREIAARKGWVVLEEHIYIDMEKTGTTVYGRDGLAKLMAAADSKPFDYILVDDTSRLGRNKADSLKNADIIKFLRIGLYFIEDELDSAQPLFDQAFHQKVYRDEEFSKSLGHKSRRGKRGRFLAGFHPGNMCYGYSNLPIEDPTRKGEYGRPAIAGVKQVINPDEAKIVVWIFEAYAAGMSYSAIAVALNQRGVPTATGTRGKRQARWCKSAVREMLANRRYLGETIWGKTRQDRDPRNGKMVAFPVPETDWDRMTMPELRIILDELFDQVQRQREIRSRSLGVKRVGGMTRTEASRKYLFSGLLRCGQCGGNMIIVTTNPARYGCASHREGKTCSNKMTVIQSELEKHLLSGLIDQVSSGALFYELVQGVSEQLKSKDATAANRKLEAVRDHTQIKNDRQRIGAEIQNVLAAIRSGVPPKSLLDELGRLEGKAAQLDEVLSESIAPPPKNLTEAEVRSFVEAALGRLRDVMSDSAEKVKAELQKRVSSIVLTPSVDSDSPLYTVTGDVALFSGPGGAVQSAQPPLDGLHYTFPISLEVRPYRRPRGWKTKEQHASDKEENEGDPILEGNGDAESQQDFGGHPDVIVATDVRDTSGIQVI